MVVVSGSWVKNVATYPTPTIINDDMVISGESRIMYAKAILICRPNSHHFQERTLILDQPVKIGRSVARAKPLATNAIFDCKVLSRHHALLWYENGKFFLQDTKSSNGTFVNNNRLTADTENHEVSSGDIVQFGVDVVENNKKVTHGCIIATLKLYLPDGKEAKASPSITDGDRHGMVPLDDLYRLNQIIQEANQREQCLETKLTALQHVVEETRKSAEESWQAYVGEERLLSRLSALENQLQQASKNWGEDRLREELSKLQEHNEAYQIAAKEALEKLHSERLEAVAAATEQERAKISAEQEVMLAKEQLAQIQLELEEVAQKVSDEQEKANEQKIRFEQREQDLLDKLQVESGRVLDLQLKLHPRLSLSICDMAPLDDLEKNIIYDDDLRAKEDMLAENDACETDVNKSNGLEPNHISLTVGPVSESTTDISYDSQSTDDDSDTSFATSLPNHSLFLQANTLLTIDEDSEGKDETTKHVAFTLPEDKDNSDSVNGADSSEFPKERNNDKSEKDEYNIDHIDSKTLKYQYQSAQYELEKKVELLRSELEKTVTEGRTASNRQMEENESLKQELVLLRQKLKESCNESQQLKDKVTVLTTELDCAEDKLQTVRKRKEKISEKDQNVAISNSLVTYDQLVNLEEELVLLKERFAEVGDEKIKLQRDLMHITEQYNLVCNKSCNKTFFYFAPLVMMVLYLLVSAMIS